LRRQSKQSKLAAPSAKNETSSDGLNDPWLGQNWLIKGTNAKALTHFRERLKGKVHKLHLKDRLGQER
jgi:hypothetical protein